MKPCKHCEKPILWDNSQKAYFEENGNQHRCSEYYKARELKEKIISKSPEDLLLQILNELMKMNLILGEIRREIARPHITD